MDASILMNFSLDECGINHFDNFVVFSSYVDALRLPFCKIKSLFLCIEATVPYNYIHTVEEALT